MLAQWRSIGREKLKCYMWKENRNGLEISICTRLCNVYLWIFWSRSTRDGWHRDYLDYLDYLTSITGRAGLVRSASPSWQWARWPSPDWGSGRRVKVLIITSAPATLSHGMSGGNFLTYPVAAALDLLCPRSHWNYIRLVFLILTPLPIMSWTNEMRSTNQLSSLPLATTECPWPS